MISHSRASLERSNGTANWNTFHAAAGSVTMLYKGSIDLSYKSHSLSRLI